MAPASELDLRTPRSPDLGPRYRVISELGRGGMGVVYEAEHLRLGCRVAVKILGPELAADEQCRKRFAREARILARLRSEHVVGALDFDETVTGVQFLVLELLEGEDLRTLLLRESRLSLPRATEVIRQVCAGLSAAHAIGVVHRDLKPKNLFVCRGAGGRDLLKILDFGVARAPASLEPASATRTGGVLGTFRYMPPEQLRGSQELGPPADVYSLGAVLHEMLTGRPPFTAEEVHVLMHQILYERAPSLETLRPELPGEVGELLRRALAPEPSDRFADADELSRALAALPGGAGRATPADVGETVTAASAPRPLPAPPRSSMSRRYLRVASIGLVATGLLFAGRWWGAAGRDPSSLPAAKSASVESTAVPAPIAEPIVAPPSATVSASAVAEAPASPGTELPPPRALSSARPTPARPSARAPIDGKEPGVRAAPSSVPPPAAPAAGRDFDRNNPYAR